MQKEIWISSHITEQEGLNYLRWCYESTKQHNATLVISYSGLMLDNIDAVLYKHEKQLFQFEHIKFIWEQRKNILEPDAIILFLDDDDMLLSKSDVEYTDVGGNRYKFSDPFEEILSDSNIPGLTGKQILGIDGLDITMNNIDNFCNDRKEIVSDFSGTIIRKKYLDTFLSILALREKNTTGTLASKVGNLLGGMLDIQFMNYIERIPNGRDANNVTVYHRLKSFQSEWLNI